MTGLVFEKTSRVILLGGGELMLVALARAKAAGLETRVIVGPRHADERLGSGSTLREELGRLGVESLESERIDTEEVQAFVSDMTETVALSFGAPWIFTAETIAGVFRDKLLNVHGTRLPRDRGGGGFSWQIMQGNRLGMCLVHKIDAGLDTGDVLAFEEFVFPPSCRTPRDYQEVYLERCAPFLERLFSRLAAGRAEFRPVPQPPYLSTYNPRLSTELSGWIDWSWSAAEIERFVCAFDDPYAGASTRWNGEKVVRLKQVSLQRGEGEFHPYQAGLVFRNNGQWLLVAAMEGQLIVESVRDEEGVDVLSKIREGDRFITGADDLARSRDRVVFTPRGLKTKRSS